MGSSDTKPETPKQPKLPVQDGTIPEWMASIHKLITTLPVIGESISLDKMNRVAPGTLKMKKPDTVVALYKSFANIFNYSWN